MEIILNFGARLRGLFLKVIWKPREISGCSFYRVLEPAKWLLHHPEVTDSVFDNLNTESPIPGSILVVLRANKPEEYEEIIAWQNAGAKVVYDLDDDIFTVPEWTSPPIYRYWSNPDHIQGAIRCMRQANAITCSTEPLRKVLSQFNEIVYVLPNRINPDHFIPKTPVEREHIVIGWMGSSTHYCDLMSIYDALHAIVKARPRIILRFLGYCPEPLRPLVQYFTNGDLSFFTLKEYPSRLRELDFDIGICPLWNHPFNRCKSPIKYLEFGAMSVPVVASRGPVFGFIQEGKDGFLAKTTSEWVDKLIALVDSVALRRQIGQAALRRVHRDFHIREDSQQRISFYQQIRAVSNLPLATSSPYRPDFSKEEIWKIH